MFILTFRKMFYEYINILYIYTIFINCVCKIQTQSKEADSAGHSGPKGGPGVTFQDGCV